MTPKFPPLPSRFRRVACLTCGVVVLVRAVPKNNAKKHCRACAEKKVRAGRDAFYANKRDFVLRAP
jgi:hypothetical protein